MLLERWEFLRLAQETWRRLARCCVTPSRVTPLLQNGRGISGSFSLSKGDPRGAELALLRSRSLAPEQVQTELALGEFYLGAKNLTAAISSFRHATRLDPQASIGFVGLAQALYFAGDLAAGAEAERRGLEIIPDLTERQQRKRELCQSLADSHAPADSRSACETLQVNDTLRTPGRD